jgi:hypothetical protein
LNPEFPYKLAPVEEVLELHPEFRSPSLHFSFLPFQTCRTPPRNMLVGVAKYCQQKKKLLWKEKNRPLCQAGLLVLELCSITFLFLP